MIFEKFFLVSFLAIKEVLAPLANDPIILGRLILLFRQLERQNLSIILDSIASRRGLDFFQHFGTGV